MEAYRANGLKVDIFHIILELKGFDCMAKLLSMRKEAGEIVLGLPLPLCFPVVKVAIQGIHMMKLDKRPEFLTKIFSGLADCLKINSKRMQNLAREDLIPLHDCTSMISDYLKQNLGIEIEEPDVESTFDSAIKFL